MRLKFKNVSTTNIVKYFIYRDYERKRIIREKCRSRNGGGENEVVTRTSLREFTDEEIAQELCARGYAGELVMKKVLSM